MKLRPFLTAAIIASTGIYFSGFTYAEDLVVMLLPENVNPRWESQDAYYFVQSMKKISPEEFFVLKY